MSRVALASRPSTFPACSDWSRSQQVRPVGTAGNYDGFLLVEQPLPWPEDVGSIDALREVAALCTERKVRLQAVVNAGTQRGGQRTLISYRRAEEGWAAPMLRAQGAVGSDLFASARALLDAPANAREAYTNEPNTSEPTTTGHSVVRAGVQELLVCTHGRRDACCGSKGAELYADLLGSIGLSGQTGSLGDTAGCTLWRTSHTGGHRFAPTLVALPEATLWAYADAQLVQALLGTAPWQEAFWDRYRGCALVGGDRAQGLECAVGRVVGRELLSARRRIEANGQRLRLVTAGYGTWEAEVVAGRRVPQPDCKTDPAAARKVSTEWVVNGLEQLSPS